MPSAATTSEIFARLSALRIAFCCILGFATAMGVCATQEAARSESAQQGDSAKTSHLPVANLLGDHVRPDDQAFRSRTNVPEGVAGHEGQSWTT